MTTQICAKTVDHNNRKKLLFTATKPMFSTRHPNILMKKSCSRWRLAVTVILLWGIFEPTVFALCTVLCSEVSTRWRGWMDGCQLKYASPHGPPNFTWWLHFIQMHIIRLQEITCKTHIPSCHISKLPSNFRPAFSKTWTLNKRAHFWPAWRLLRFCSIWRLSLLLYSE